MRNTFFVLSIVGLFLGLVVHIYSLFGIDVGETIQFIWGLHIGVFIVWFPAILELAQRPEFKNRRFNNRMKNKEFYGILFKDTPKPMQVITMVFLAYAIINFFLFVSGNFGIGGVTESQAIETTSNANEIRGFSGHWMLFYSMAAAILWPKKNLENEQRNANTM